MKKIISAVLASTMLVSVSCMCFAEEVNSNRSEFSACADCKLPNAEELDSLIEEKIEQQLEQYKFEDPKEENYSKKQNILLSISKSILKFALITLPSSLFISTIFAKMNSSEWVKNSEKMSAAFKVYNVTNETIFKFSKKLFYAVISNSKSFYRGLKK